MTTMGNVWAQLLAALESFRNLPGVEKAAWAQAVAAIFTALVTGVYAFLTYQLIHAPHRAYLKPLGTEIQGDDWQLVVRNFGPGVATQVQVKCMQIRRMSFDPRKGKALRTWVNMAMQPLNGPYEVNPLEQGRYDIGPKTQFRYPVFITWRTVTGLRQSSAWRITIDREDQVSKLGPIDMVRYVGVRIWEELRSPVITAEEFLVMRRHHKDLSRGKQDTQ